jgi:pimeloyl-ACP methyl ester carboxylesterase
MPSARAEELKLSAQELSESAVRAVVVTETFWRWRRGRIRVWETAPHPSGRAVILIHGYAAMIEHWRKNVAALAQDATVYAMDLLGFGQSDIPDVHYSAKLWGEQIRDFMDERGVRRAAIFGHSMGGLVAGQFAHDFPDRTAAVVLVDPSGWPKRVPSDLMFHFVRFAATNPILQAASFFLFATPTMARQGLESAYYDQSAVTPELVELFSAPLRNRDAMRSYLAVARQPDDFYIHAPNGIGAPTLIVWGGRDRLLSPKLLTPFRELIPHADVALIPDTGHCPQDETPERFNACVSEFLRSLP